MKCTYEIRCVGSELIYYQNIFICKKCNSIFEKPDKILNKQIIIRCCKKQKIIYSYNKPICNSCKTICVINI